ncbi:MAG: hypothetical protein AAGA70_02790 [Pseudomonadota bacterium]
MSLEREEIEALLPFLANETLTGDERTEVETAVAGDPRLASELAALRAIRRQMQGDEAEASPGDLGLARLMRDVDRDASAAHSTTAAANSPKVVPLSRLRIWQSAAVVVLGLGIGQAVLTTGPDDPGAVPLPPEVSLERSTDFSLADGASPAESAAMSQVAFRIIFADGVSEAEMRAFLLNSGLEIVAGPSAMGFYDLAPLDGDRAAARAAITAAGPLIDTVEDMPN